MAVHVGLIIAICIGGIAQPGHVGLPDLEPASLQVVMVELGRDGGTFSGTNHVRETARKLVHMADPMFVDAEKIPREAGSGSSILPALLPTPPYYFSAKELTQRPLVARDVPADLMLVVPDVPAQAATLQILINEYGEIDRVIVEDSLLPETAQKTVVDAFVKTRFHPGEINGVPVKSQLRIEIMLEEIDGEK
ncbi:hypothetical protein [Herminiimonas fonticola]|uniref:hypothetical protein n=1 Tax=Herminiimonas fonticola TaxID=303380 RepID=UPI0010606639|nr:hypothetical protein [Herminiimonas fonticola]